MNSHSSLRRVSSETRASLMAGTSQEKSSAAMLLYLKRTASGEEVDGSLVTRPISSCKTSVFTKLKRDLVNLYFASASRSHKVDSYKFISFRLLLLHS